MENGQLRAVEMEMHENAPKKARQHINQFSTSLILQAKIIAYRTKADIVLAQHIDEALDTINSEKKQSWSRELLIILGGTFTGAFIQGFVSELSSGNTLLVAIYTILGFVGMFMVFLGLRR
ncbi:MAG: hypothetical protein J0L96_14530 [Anaerolineae bacterium]|nr:hypothetical protein [Anaerolineae bacterium]